MSFARAPTIDDEIEHANRIALGNGMELRQLRAFVEVARNEHFGRAAAATKITQPALTQRIQSLERELGVQLLTRTSREVRLTQAGETLLPYARGLVLMADQALAELANVEAGQAGRLRVAYLLHGDVALQGKVVAEFRRRYPHVQVSTSAGHSRANVDLLRNGEADAAFIELPAEIPDGIALQSFGGRHQLMLALPLGHELANSASVPVNELAGMPLVLTPASENPAMRAAFIAWLTRLTGKDAKVLAEEPVDQAIQFIATLGTAAAVVNWWSASAGAPGVVFKPLTPAPLVEFSVAYRLGDPLPVLKNLLAVVEEVSDATPEDDHVTGELL